MRQGQTNGKISALGTGDDLVGSLWPRLTGRDGGLTKRPVLFLSCLRNDPFTQVGKPLSVRPNDIQPVFVPDDPSKHPRLPSVTKHDQAIGVAVLWLLWGQASLGLLPRRGSVSQVRDKLDNGGMRIGGDGCA